MLRALLDLFSPSGRPDSTTGPHSLELATAVLLVEVMRADPAIGEAERLAVVQALRRKFTLDDAELERLLQLAHDTARSANDFFAFTSAVNDGLSHAEKVRIVEHMWEVAFADGHLDAHESHLISRVAGLLHVTHGEYIAAKLHARQTTGARAPE